MPDILTPEQREAVRAAVPVVRDFDLAVADHMAAQWRSVYGEPMPPQELAAYVRTGQIVRKGGA